jgi:hypothetical protein
VCQHCWAIFKMPTAPAGAGGSAQHEGGETAPQRAA